MVLLSGFRQMTQPAQTMLLSSRVVKSGLKIIISLILPRLNPWFTWIFQNSQTHSAMKLQIHQQSEYIWDPGTSEMWWPEKPLIFPQKNIRELSWVVLTCIQFLALRSQSRFSFLFCIIISLFHPQRNAIRLIGLVRHEIWPVQQKKMNYYHYTLWGPFK